MKKIVIVFVAVFCVHSAIFSQDTTKTKRVPCTPKNAFGLDLGAGAIKIGVLDAFVMPALEIGMRYSHNFNHYIGIDFIKFNSKFRFKKEIDSNSYTGSDINKYFSVNTQWMLGVRGNTPTFYKCMSGYWAVRAGFGFVYESYEHEEYYFLSYLRMVEKTALGVGVCMEFEFGFNITRELFIGYAQNLQLDNYGILLCGSGVSHSFRIGINIK